MTYTSLAHSAPPEETEKRECTTCEGEGTITLSVSYEYSSGLLTTECIDCAGCSGTGARAVFLYDRAPRYCATCGERAGSISGGSGAPLVGRRGGPFYHVGCEPDALSDTEIDTALTRMGG